MTAERTEREAAAIERMAHEVVYLAYAADGPAQHTLRALAREVLPEHVIEEFRSPPQL